MFSIANQNLFLTYPLPNFHETNLMDYSYLEELYPVTIKVYQIKVKEAVNQLDYPGSMIYDEYPDALSLYRIASQISDDILLNQTLEKKIDEELQDMVLQQKEIEERTNEKGPCKLIELIQVLLYMEIHKRRVAKNSVMSTPIFIPENRIMRREYTEMKEDMTSNFKNKVEKIEKTFYNKE